MKVSIIGSGNVATVLGRAVRKAGHQVLQVYSRNIWNAVILAKELMAEPTDDWQKLDNDADVYIMALSDAAIPDAAQNIHLQKGILMHTAGAVSKNVLQNAAVHYGVLYPLQSLRKEKADYANIPFLVDGGTSGDLAAITAFAKTIGPLVQYASDKERLKLHLAAVMVSNFTNYLYALAEGYCQKENLPFQLLQPLIAEVADRLQNHHAAEMQTGPAIRGDVATIEKHMQLLKDYPTIQDVYAFLSNKIMEDNGLRQIAS